MSLFFSFPSLSFLSLSFPFCHFFPESAMFARLTKRISRSVLFREVTFTLETLCFSEKDRFLRQTEDLCLTLADRRFRPYLPRMFPSVIGPRKIDFIPSRAILFGDPKAMRRPVIALVSNELKAGRYSASDIPEIVIRILDSAETLRETGNGLPRNPSPVYQTEGERRSALFSVIGNGKRRVTIDTRQFDSLVSDPSDLSPPSPLSPRVRFARSANFFTTLKQGGTLFEAAVSAGIMSENTLTVARGIRDLRHRLGNGRGGEGRGERGRRGGGGEGGRGER